MELVVFTLMRCFTLQMGVLSVKRGGTDQNEDGELTFLGRVLAHLPVDLYLGKMIVLGHVFGCLDECLIIGQSVIMLLEWTCVICTRLQFTEV